MGELAGISGKEAVKKLTRIGYAVVRQRGSHVRLIHHTPKEYPPITVPLHKELRIGLVLRIIKDAKLTPKSFLEL